MKILDYRGLKEVSFYYPNIELSKALHDKFNRFIRLKECYNNIFCIVNNSFTLEKDYPNIQVVYGGVQINETNLFVKHCFFRFNDEVIDPTLYKNNSLNKNSKYFSIIEYSVSEYIEMLVRAKETFPVDIMKKLNMETLNLIKYNVIYAG